jgi:hypothetical protein
MQYNIGVSPSFTFSCPAGGTTQYVGHAKCPAGTIVVNCARHNATYYDSMVVDKAVFNTATVGWPYNLELSLHMVYPGKTWGGQTFPYGGCGMGYSCSSSTNTPPGGTHQIQAICLSV